MTITKTAHELPIWACTACGAMFDNTAFKPETEEAQFCPVHGCGGMVKAYEPESVVMANLLDRRGFYVKQFHIGKETDSECGIFIHFADRYSLRKVPGGFTVTETGAPHFPVPSPVFIEKTYDKGMSKEELAVQLARDKAALYRWILRCT